MKLQIINKIVVVASIAFLASILPGCRSSGSDSGNGTAKTKGQEQLKKVSFTLLQVQKPFANEEVAVVPLLDGKVLTSDETRLGLGQTDAQGRATIEFRAPPQYSEYVLVWRTRGVYMMLRNGRDALTFKCDAPTCDLGDVIFEAFEFSGSGR
jgi:hypothetical protein